MITDRYHLFVVFPWLKHPQKEQIVLVTNCQCCLQYQASVNEHIIDAQTPSQCTIPLSILYIALLFYEKAMFVFQLCHCSVRKTSKTIHMSSGATMNTHGHLNGEITQEHSVRSKATYAPIPTPGVLPKS